MLRVFIQKETAIVFTKKKRPHIFSQSLLHSLGQF